MKHSSLILLGLSLSLLAAQAKASPQPYENFSNVEFVKNHDGDSITFNIPQAPAIIGKNMVIRLRGIDTPELSGKGCTKSKNKAIKAKTLVSFLLNKAQTINLRHLSRGKYFRILADVEFDGKDLATALLGADLAVKYYGGKKKDPWCHKEPPPPDGPHWPYSVLPPKISGVYIWPPPPGFPKDTPP